MTEQQTIVDVDAIAAEFPRRGAVEERVGRPDPHADLRQLFTRKRPLLMRGLARDWPALQRWTFDFLAEKGTGTNVEVTCSIREQYTTSNQPCDLGDYIRGIIADDGTVTGGTNQRYLAYSWLMKDLPELRDDIPLREMFGPRTHKLPAVWIGPAGTITGLHSDNVYPNVLTQVRGRKSVVLFEPGSPTYKSDKYEFCTSTSAVDLRTPDFDRFPLLRGAAPLVAHLDEGDGLFIPPKWWHFVVSDTPSISVSTFFGTPRHVAPAAAAELTKGLLHRVGLYARGNCVCHSSAASPPGQ